MRYSYRRKAVLWKRKNLNSDSPSSNFGTFASIPAVKYGGWMNNIDDQSDVNNATYHKVKVETPLQQRSKSLPLFMHKRLGYRR